MTLATGAALASAGAVLGVARTAAAPGRPVEVVDYGPIDPALVNVGPGPASAVIVETLHGSSPTLRRACEPALDDYVFGACDTNGRVTVAPRRAAATVTNRVIDVRDYGARPDASADASPAFEAALAALPWGAASATIYVPPGRYRLSRDLHVYRAVHLLGAGGGTAGNNLVQLIFGPGCGIAVDINRTSPELGNGAGAIIENLRISGTHPTVDGRWTPNTAYAVGRRVHVNTALPTEASPPFRTADPPFRGLRFFHWECVRAGTSSGQLPMLVTPPAYHPDTGFIPPLVDEWSPGKRVRVGQCVHPTFGSESDHRHVFMCTFDETVGPGYRTTGTQEPPWGSNAVHEGDITWVQMAWMTAIDTSPHIYDEGVDPATHLPRPRWVARAHTAIRMHIRCTVQNCYIENFLNAGIYVLGDTALLGTNADGWQVRDTQISNCGIGMFVYGNDANNGTALGVQALGSGMHPDTTWMDFTRGLPSEDGNEVARMMAALAAGSPAGSNGGYGFFDASELGCNWIGCHAEPSTDRAIVVLGRTAMQHSSVIGCHFEGARQPAFVVGTATVVGGWWTEGLEGDPSGMFGADRGFTRVFERDTKSLGTTVALHTRIHSGHPDSVLGWVTSRANTDANWIEWQHDREALRGEWTFGTGLQPLFSVADGLSPSGGGWRDVFGHFRGYPQADHYLGVYPNTDVLSVVRRGYRKIGDRFETNAPLAARGRFLGRVVVRAGMVGERGLGAGSGYTQYNSAAGYPASTVEHRGFVYVCTRTGTSTGFIPAATGASATWLAAHPDEIVPPMTWRPGFLEWRECLIRPSNPGTHGHAYFRCIALKGTSRTALVEPDWSTQATTFWDGDVQWQREGAEDPGWIIDEGPGAPQWTRMGAPASFADYGPVYERGSLVTTDATPGVLDTYAVEPDACTHFEIVVTAFRKALAGAPAEPLEAASFVLRASYVRSGNEQPVVVAPLTVEAHANGAGSPWTALLELDAAGELEVRVRGDAQKTIHWRSLRRPHG